MSIGKIKNLLIPIHQYILWLLIGMLLGGILASTITYPLRVSELTKISNVCSEMPNDKIIVVKISALGHITDVICRSGVDLQIKH